MYRKRRGYASRYGRKRYGRRSSYRSRGRARRRMRGRITRPTSRQRIGYRL